MSRVLKGPERDADNSSQSTAKFKNGCIYNPLTHMRSWPAIWQFYAYFTHIKNVKTE
jgi:hypothetical protein